ncbi:MAG: ATP-cone domain protein [Candidatus Adlerbacteria bacterium]|nr:ATP-cone domain protein [Candidatus Adlerbacteria bacterium]
MLVIKSDGYTEEFDPSKLHSSLIKAGADVDTAKRIVSEISKDIYSGISTTEIYRTAFSHLRGHRRAVAARYSLKRAILDFGPSGFPFEMYLAEIFKTQGYTTRVDQIIQGGCVDHEVDVVLAKDHKTTYIEAKFHNTLGFKTDLKTALYVKARLEDIEKNPKNPKPMSGMLVTNTKFTSKAVQYATCAGVGLLGWDYPGTNNLHDMIDTAKVYPVTALTSLSKQEKTALLSAKVVLCNALPEQEEALHRAGIKASRTDAIFKEAAGLCVPGKGI